MFACMYMQTRVDWVVRSWDCSECSNVSGSVRIKSRCTCINLLALLHVRDQCIAMLREVLVLKVVCAQLRACMSAAASAIFNLESENVCLPSVSIWVEYGPWWGAWTFIYVLLLSIVSKHGSDCTLEPWISNQPLGHQKACLPHRLLGWPYAISFAGKIRFGESV